MALNWSDDANLLEEFFLIRFFTSFFFFKPDIPPPPPTALLYGIDSSLDVKYKAYFWRM